METQTRVKIFAGGLKRFFAYIIDVLILNIVFLLLYFILKVSGYEYLDYWIIYLIIYLLYFTLGDSLLFHGQTLGKKYLNIQVVNITGSNISTAFSFFRTVFTSVLYFNYHFIILINDFLKLYINELLITIFILFMVSILFFGVSIFLVFHPCYQGIQDVIFRTFVLKKDSYNKEQIESSFNLTRLTASYFFMFIFTIISIIIGTIVKVFWA